MTRGYPDSTPCTRSQSEWREEALGIAGGSETQGALAPKVCEVAKVSCVLGDWVIGLRSPRRVGLLSWQHPAQPVTCSGAGCSRLLV